MSNAWFSSASNRRSQPRQRLFDLPTAPEEARSGPSDASSASQSTVGPLRTPGNLTSVSDIRLDEVHARINDPSVYARTPSLIHSTEKEAGALRISDVPTSPDAPAYQCDGDQIVKQPPALEHVEDTMFTPQDAIITRVFGKSAPRDVAHATPPAPSSAPQPSVSVQMTSDSLPPLPSMQAASSSGARSGPTLTIYDPFSGARLGEHTPVSPSTVTPGGLSSPAPPHISDDGKLWSSLERILGLQAEIAMMHADMEGVGGRGLGSIHTGGMTSVDAEEGGNVGPSKRSRRGQTLPIGDEDPEEPEQEGVATGGATSEISTDHSDGGDENEDEEDEEDIRGYGKKRRDEEFAKLAEQFTQRKAAIGKIMNKLDDLSTALKTFHTLPAPLFNIATPPSRADTMSSTPSNVSVTSSSPPLHVYPGRSSSPFPSTPSPQVAKLVTTPPGSLSPPVPPISTLAPPTSSGDSNPPPGLGLMVPPVLPRTALPTIILGSQHVESPADMGPGQSVFHGMP